MSRTDIHQDAMLRHLGAAYYESLHGRALPTDVTPAHPSTVHPSTTSHPSTMGHPSTTGDGTAGSGTS